MVNPEPVPESVDQQAGTRANQDMVVDGALAKLTFEGHDLSGIDPALAAIAYTDPKELSDRILADTLGDVQKRNIRLENGQVVGEVTPHGVRSTAERLHNKGVQFAGGLALAAAIAVAGGLTYEGAHAPVKPGSQVEVTSGDVIGGAIGGGLAGAGVFMAGAPIFAGRRGVQRRAKRELGKQLRP